VIEHNLEVIKTADWNRPRPGKAATGGDRRARLAGEVVREKRSYTGAFLEPCWKAHAGAQERHQGCGITDAPPNNARYPAFITFILGCIIYDTHNLQLLV
jgi:hypothetical protein